MKYLKSPDIHNALSAQFGCVPPQKGPNCGEVVDYQDQQNIFTTYTFRGGGGTAIVLANNFVDIWAQIQTFTVRVVGECRAQRAP